MQENPFMPDTPFIERALFQDSGMPLSPCTGAPLSPLTPHFNPARCERLHQQEAQV